MHRMEEKGEINLLNPISHYIPEFAKHGKERTTIYHLLSHRAGIPGIAGVDDPRVVLDHEPDVPVGRLEGAGERYRWLPEAH